MHVNNNRNKKSEKKMQNEMNEIFFAIFEVVIAFLVRIHENIIE